MKLSVVSWKWFRQKGRSKFTSEYVNTLKRMVQRNLAIDHEFVCITDDPEGLDNDIRYVPLFEEFNRWPRCFPRLKMFSKEIALSGEFCEFILSIDLDVVITDDITSLIDFNYDFIISRVAKGDQPYNGSFWQLRLGSRPQVWEKIPEDSINIKQPAFGGSDQAWLAYILGPNEKTVGPEEGVYGYMKHVKGKELPKNAKLVTFQGGNDPWHSNIMRKERWIEHYRK